MWDIVVGKRLQGAFATPHVYLKETAAKTPAKPVSPVRQDAGIQNVNPVKPANPVPPTVALVPTSVAMEPAETQKHVSPAPWTAVIPTVETALVMEEKTARTALGIAVNAKKKSQVPA